MHSLGKSVWSAGDLRVRLGELTSRGEAVIGQDKGSPGASSGAEGERQRTKASEVNTEYAGCDACLTRLGEGGGGRHELPWHFIQNTINAPLRLTMALCLLGLGRLHGFALPVFASSAGRRRRSVASRAKCRARHANIVVGRRPRPFEVEDLWFGGSTDARPKVLVVLGSGFPSWMAWIKVRKQGLAITTTAATRYGQALIRKQCPRGLAERVLSLITFSHCRCSHARPSPPPEPDSCLVLAAVVVRAGQASRGRGDEIVGW